MGVPAHLQRARVGQRECQLINREGGEAKGVQGHWQGQWGEGSVHSLTEGTGGVMCQFINRVGWWIEGSNSSLTEGWVGQGE